MANAELIHAAVVVRHGDRSAIHTLPGTVRSAWPCGAPSIDDVRWATSLLRPLHSSSACVSSGVCNATVPITEDARADAALPSRVLHAAEAWRTARASGDICGPLGGELSSIGWAQELRIGHSLGRRYAALLRADVPGSSAIQVVTTDTGRTALSATALLQGVLAAVAAAAPSPSEGAHVGDNGGDDDDDDDNDDDDHDNGGGSPSDRASSGDRSPTLSSVSEARTAGQFQWHHRKDDSAVADARFAKQQSRAWRHRHVVPQLPQLGPLPLPLHIVDRAHDPVMATMGRGEACPRLMGILGPLRREETTANDQDAVQDSDDDDGHASALQQLQPQLVNRIAAVGSLRASDVAVTEAVADDILTRLCGGHALPCWRHAAGRPAHVVLHEMRCADRADGVGNVTSTQTARAVRAGEPRARVGHSVEGVASATAVGGGAMDVVDALLSTSSAVTVGSEDEDAADDVCLTVDDAANVLQRADGHYARLYSSAFVRVLMYPFLAQVVRGMDAAADGVNGAQRLVLRAAHDTVIAPVLGALNATTEREPWPRYAARLVFELWRDRPGRDVDSGSQALRVRLVVDGVDVTRRLSCADADTGAQHPTCLLSAFRRMVDDLLAPYRKAAGQTWEDICSVSAST